METESLALLMGSYDRVGSQEEDFQPFDSNENE